MRNVLTHDKPINFNVALEGGDYEASDASYTSAALPTFNEWSSWGSCFPECGPTSIRSRTRACTTEYCPGVVEETETCTMPACTVDQHECISDDQGTKWRPLILQYKANGGIPTDQYDCIYQSQTTPCSYGADPPVAGRDYINLNNFNGYQIDGKYHMKILWSYGESMQWKQEESIFRVNKVQTVSDVVGTNHKGHTDMVFTGMAVTNWGQRFHFHLFDGSTENPVTSAWDESMPSCSSYGTNWRTYASVVWEADYHYDKGNFQSDIFTQNLVQ